VTRERPIRRFGSKRTHRSPLEPPDLIFFDVGETLLTPDPSWAEIYRQACAPFGMDIDLDRLSATLANAPFDLGQPYEPSEEASFERVRAYDAQILAALGYPDPPEAVFRAIGAAFSAREAWLVFPDVLPALRALEGAGIRRAVISNWVWGAPQLLHDLELAAYFEALVISARIGRQKPDRAIFQHALELTGVAPERAWHVGDSYRADVLGARSVGIQPVLIDRHVTDAAKPPVPDVASDDEVSLVRDLFGVLDLLDISRPTSPSTARRAGP
jgi:putative hydrolase of the HAD superfamily